MAFVAGAIFGAGLVVARATDPAVVLGFLDVGGAWNPQILFMFLGAAPSYAALRALIAPRQRPWLEPVFDPPVRAAVDRRLLLGATVFGVGWGLAGICPGPAFTSLLSGAVEPVVFTAAMLAGMWVFERARAASAVPA